MGFRQPLEESGADYGYQEFRKSLSAVIVGAKTYEQVLGFNLPEWPYQGLPVCVCTKRELPTSVDPQVWLWPDSVEALVRQLPQGRTWLTGGAGSSTRSTRWV